MATERVTVKTNDGTEFQIEYRFVELNKSERRELVRMLVPTLHGCVCCDKKRQGGKLFLYGECVNGVNQWDTITDANTNRPELFCSASCRDYYRG